MTKFDNKREALRYHVSGAIARGEAEAIVEAVETVNRASERWMIETLLCAVSEVAAEFDARSARAAEEPGCGGLVESPALSWARALLYQAQARGYEPVVR